jgi:hypothetical protein
MPTLRAYIIFAVLFCGIIVLAPLSNFESWSASKRMIIAETEVGDSLDENWIKTHDNDLRERREQGNQPQTQGMCVFCLKIFMDPQ